MATEVMLEDKKPKKTEKFVKLKCFCKKYLANNELLSIPFLSIIVSFLSANFIFYPRFFREDPLLLVFYLLVIGGVNYQLHNGLTTADGTKFLFWFLIKLIEILVTCLSLYKVIIETIQNNPYYPNYGRNICYGIVLIVSNAILIRAVCKKHKEFETPTEPTDQTV